MLSFRWQNLYLPKFVNNYVTRKIFNLKTNIQSGPDMWCESGVRHRMDKVQLQQSTINQSMSQPVVETQICFLVCSVSFLEE